MEINYQLSRPLILFFNYDGIEREELIDRVTVRCLPAEPGEREREMEACRALYDRIDKRFLDPFTVEELSEMNGCGRVIQEAYYEAAGRARAFCEAKAEQLARIEGMEATRRVDAMEHPYLRIGGRTLGVGYRSVPLVDAAGHVL